MAMNEETEKEKLVSAWNRYDATRYAVFQRMIPK